MNFSVEIDFEQYIRLMKIAEKFKDEIELREKQINGWKDIADIYKMRYYTQIDRTISVRKQKEYWFKKYRKLLKKYKNVMNNASE